MHLFTQYAPALIMGLFSALLAWLGFHLLPTLVASVFVVFGIIFILKLIFR